MSLKLVKMPNTHIKEVQYQEKDFLVIKTSKGAKFVLDKDCFDAINNKNQYGKICSFYKTKFGYIQQKYNKKALYIHRLIAEKYIENPQKCKYIEFISGDHMDMRLCNLKWTNVSDENKINNKRKRDLHMDLVLAKIKEDDIPKYVYYSSNDERFIIDKKHPLLKQSIAGSRSKLKTLPQKLEQIKEKLTELGPIPFNDTIIERLNKECEDIFDLC